METTGTPEDNVSFDEIRSRFVEAEEHLAHLADRAEQLRAEGATLAQSRESIAAATQALVGIADNLGQVMEGFKEHDALLRRGIELLAAADPLAIREEIALVRAAVDQAREQSSGQLAALEARAREDSAASATRDSEAIARLASARRYAVVGVALSSVIALATIAIVVLVFVR